jgi:hypothetical protein
MTDQALVVLNQALARAYRLLGRETLRQYLALSLEALDVMDEQAREPRGGSLRDELKRSSTLLRRLGDIVERRKAISSSR